jgi:hypothetical protein
VAQCVLRHTHASYLAVMGASSIELKESLGHKTLVMVARHTHLANITRSEVAARLTRPGPARDARRVWQRAPRSGPFCASERYTRWPDARSMLTVSKTSRCVLSARVKTSVNRAGEAVTVRKPCASTPFS